jgi:hypothetical protein
MNGKVALVVVLGAAFIYVGLKRVPELSPGARQELKNMPRDESDAVLTALQAAGMDEYGRFSVTPGDPREAGDTLMSLASQWEARGYAHLASDAREQALRLGAQAKTPSPTETVPAPDPELLTRMARALEAVGYDAFGNIVGPVGTAEAVEELRSLARELRDSGLPVSAGELEEIANRAEARQKESE